MGIWVAPQLTGFLKSASALSQFMIPHYALRYSARGTGRCSGDSGDRHVPGDGVLSPAWAGTERQRGEQTIRRPAPQSLWKIVTPSPVVSVLISRLPGRSIQSQSYPVKADPVRSRTGKEAKNATVLHVHDATPLSGRSGVSRGGIGIQRAGRVDDGGTGVDADSDAQR